MPSKTAVPTAEGVRHGGVRQTLSRPTTSKSDFGEIQDIGLQYLG